MTPRFLTSAEEARAVVEAGDADAGIVVPPGFSAAVQQGRDASLTVLHRRDRPVSGAVAQALADGYAARVSTGQLAVRTTAGLRNAVPPPAEAAELANRAAGETPVAVAEGPTGRNEFKAASYFGPAMSVFFLFFTVGFGARGFLEERREGTLARMVAAPIRSWSILLGKALAAFVLGLGSMLVMWVASTAIFRATWGPPLRPRAAGGRSAHDVDPGHAARRPHQVVGARRRARCDHLRLAQGREPSARGTGARRRGRDGNAPRRRVVPPVLGWDGDLPGSAGARGVTTTTPPRRFTSTSSSTGCRSRVRCRRG